MATGDSPPRIPPRDRAQNEARRDPSRPAETGKSWPAQRQPGGDIVKEHGQTLGRDAQEIKPSTTCFFARRADFLSSCLTRTCCRTRLSSTPASSWSYHTPSVGI